MYYSFLPTQILHCYVTHHTSGRHGFTENIIKTFSELRDMLRGHGTRRTVTWHAWIRCWEAARNSRWCPTRGAFQTQFVLLHCYEPDHEYGRWL